MKTIYKIQRKSDGLFSKGGCHPSFDAKGKSWSARGHVSSHISHVGGYGKKLEDFYNDCEVVLFEVVEVPIETIQVSEWKVTDKTARAKFLEEERNLKRDKEALAKRMLELEKELAKLKGI